MKRISFDLKLKIAGFIISISIIVLIVFMAIKMNITVSDIEEKQGIVSFVIEKNGMYNFKLKDDINLYGKGIHTNNDIISNFIYKQISGFSDINKQKHKIIKLNDTISFSIKKDTHFAFKLSGRDTLSLPYLNESVIIRRIANSGIKQTIIISVNHKQITNAQSDYIFSSGAKITLNIIYVLCILLVIIFIFLWILKATDKKNQETENQQKQIEEQHTKNILLLEKQLSAYIDNGFNSIPAQQLSEITNLADLYWITKKDINKAEEIYKKILLQYPTNLNALIMYGEFLYSEERLSEADKVMERAKEIDPDVSLLIKTNHKYLQNRK